MLCDNFQRLSIPFIHALAVFLSVLAFEINSQENNGHTYNADTEVEQMERERHIFKGCVKASAQVNNFCGDVRTSRKPERLSDFIKQP